MQSVSLAMSKKIESISFGIAFLNFNYGDIEWHPPYPTEDSLTYYSANDFSIIIGGNAYISPRGKIGLNLKYITENIYVYSDYALAFDLSFAYTGSKTGISFGVTNFGSKITSNNEEVNLPARMSIGGFYDFKKFIPSADLHYLVNNGIFEFGLGVEIPINKFIALSGALHYRHTFYPGFGVAINSGKIGVKYAGSFYPADLGMINTIGIGFEF